LLFFPPLMEKKSRNPNLIQTDRSDLYIFIMDKSPTKRSYKKLGLAVFNQAVVDARSRNVTLRLEAIDWLRSDGYAWLLNWGFGVRPNHYALFLERLEQQLAAVSKKKVGDHAP